MAKGHCEPLRTCLGCGAQARRRQLIRLRAGVAGELIVDSEDVGRGGYLHRFEECWEKFTRRKSVYKAFHVEIGKSARDKLVQKLKERHGE